MAANVHSIEALERVRDELIRFRQRSTDGMDELAGEIRRVLDWVEHDRPAYWKMRVRKAYDQITEAKIALEQCKMKRVGDERPACAEEKAALKKAQAHLAHCEQKQQSVREWARTLRHEMHEYEGRMSLMKTLVDIDLPRTISLIERQTDALDRYLNGVPTAPLPKAESPDTAADDAPTEDPQP